MKSFYYVILSLLVLSALAFFAVVLAGVFGAVDPRRAVAGGLVLMIACLLIAVGVEDIASRLSGHQETADASTEKDDAE